MVGAVSVPTDQALDHTADRADADNAADQGDRATHDPGGGPPRRRQVALRMRGLPFTATQTDVANFFDGYGVRREDVKLSYRSDGSPSGEAHVFFIREDLAAKALRERNMQHLGHRYIELFPAVKADGSLGPAGHVKAAAWHAAGGGYGPAAPPGGAGAFFGTGGGDGALEYQFAATQMAAATQAAQYATVVQVLQAGLTGGAADAVKAAYANWYAQQCQAAAASGPGSLEAPPNQLHQEYPPPPPIGAPGAMGAVPATLPGSVHAAGVADSGGAPPCFDFDAAVAATAAHAKAYGAGVAGPFDHHAAALWNPEAGMDTYYQDTSSLTDSGPLFYAEI